MPKAVRIIILLAVLVVVAVVVMALNLNTIVKNGVETVGPIVMGVDVELEKSDLSLFSGGGSLKGLKVHNPEGYKTEHLFNLGNITLEVELGSIIGDTIHIKKIHVDAPHVIFEGSLIASNIKTLLNNLKGEEAASGGDESEAGSEQASTQETKLIIDHLLIENVKMGVSSKILQGKALTLPLPPIELKDIGKDSGGATPAEVVTDVVKTLYTSVEPAIKKAFTNIGSGLKKIGGGLKDSELDDKLKKGLDKGIKNLFGK